MELLQIMPEEFLEIRSSLVEFLKEIQMEHSVSDSVELLNWFLEELRERIPNSTLQKKLHKLSEELLQNSLKNSQRKFRGNFTENFRKDFWEIFWNYSRRKFRKTKFEGVSRWAEHLRVHVSENIRKHSRKNFQRNNQKILCERSRRNFHMN